MARRHTGAACGTARQRRRQRSAPGAWKGALAYFAMRAVLGAPSCGPQLTKRVCWHPDAPGGRAQGRCQAGAAVLLCRAGAAQGGGARPGHVRRPQGQGPAEGHQARSAPAPACAQCERADCGASARPGRAVGGLSLPGVLLASCSSVRRGRGCSRGRAVEAARDAAPKALERGAAAAAAASRTRTGAGPPAAGRPAGEQAGAPSAPAARAGRAREAAPGAAPARRSGGSGSGGRHSGSEGGGGAEGGGKSTSDEELARRLHQQLNGPASPTALTRQRKRKQPLFYTPEVPSLALCLCREGSCWAGLQTGGGQSGTRTLAAGAQRCAQRARRTRSTSVVAAAGLPRTRARAGGRRRARRRARAAGVRGRGRGGSGSGRRAAGAVRPLGVRGRGAVGPPARQAAAAVRGGARAPAPRARATAVRPAVAAGGRWWALKCAQPSAGCCAV